MKRGLFAAVAPAALSALAACGAARNAPATSGGSAARSRGGELVPTAAPDVELHDAAAAIVGAKPVPMDGVAEGLAWPALRAAVARKPGDHAPLSITVSRNVPMTTVMRAVWTLRDADIRLQTPDAEGTLRVLELRPKPDSAPVASDAECHLAVFVAPSGDLRVATPGGPHLIPNRVPGPSAASAFASALTSEGAHCAIRYVGFGAESGDAQWGSVFDVARAVDRDKSAGDARYVLAEPIH
jgi:hypothetical protein